MVERARAGARRPARRVRPGVDARGAPRGGDGDDESEGT